MNQIKIPELEDLLRVDWMAFSVKLIVMPCFSKYSLSGFNWRWIIVDSLLVLRGWKNTISFKSLKSSAGKCKRIFKYKTKIIEII